MLTEEGFFRGETDAINAANAEYKAFAANPELAQLKAEIKADREAYQQEENAQRQVMITGRAERKQQRKQGEQTLNPEELKTLLDDLGKQSVAEKNVLKYLKQAWNERLTIKEARLAELEQTLAGLKEQRKDLSNALQHKLHKQYRFLDNQVTQSATWWTFLLLLPIQYHQPVLVNVPLETASVRIQAWLPTTSIS